MEKLYYYEFVIRDYDDYEQTFRHYEVEELDENGIAKLEDKILKVNPNLAYCKYVGEGRA